MFFNLVGIPFSMQCQSWVVTLGQLINDFGSRIKNIHKSFFGETNQPVGVGNVSFYTCLFKTSTKIYSRLYPDIIDWYQGRFSGQTIRIVVREGKIIEKVFLTPKGNKMSVRISHLLMRLRSLPSIQIKLSLRYRLIEKIQRNLKSISLISI